MTATKALKRFKQLTFQLEKFNQIAEKLKNKKLVYPIQRYKLTTYIYETTCIINNLQACIDNLSAHIIKEQIYDTKEDESSSKVKTL